MATPLEIKKIKAELLRVQAAKADMEVRIEDHMENISRLNVQMDLSSQKELELQKQLQEITN